MLSPLPAYASRCDVSGWRMKRMCDGDDAVGEYNGCLSFVSVVIADDFSGTKDIITSHHIR